MATLEAVAKAVGKVAARAVVARVVVARVAAMVVAGKAVARAAVVKGAVPRAAVERAMGEMADSTAGWMGAAGSEGRTCELRNPRSRSQRRMRRCRDWGLHHRTRRPLRICMCCRSTYNLGPVVAVRGAVRMAAEAAEAEAPEELAEPEGASMEPSAGVAAGSGPACPELHS